MENGGQKKTLKCISGETNLARGCLGLVGMEGEEDGQKANGKTESPLQPFQAGKRSFHGKPRHIYIERLH